MCLCKKALLLIGGQNAEYERSKGTEKPTLQRMQRLASSRGYQEWKASEVFSPGRRLRPTREHSPGGLILTPVFQALWWCKKEKIKKKKSQKSCWHLWSVSSSLLFSSPTERIVQGALWSSAAWGLFIQNTYMWHVCIVLSIYSHF